MRKKIFGFVLVVAMAVALFAGMTVMASAEEVQLTQKEEINTPLHILPAYGTENDIIETVDNLETEGWAWDKETRTLTLGGLNLVVDANSEGGDIAAIMLPAGSTIVILDGTENKIDNRTMDPDSIGIFAKGALTIRGPQEDERGTGTLWVQAWNCTAIATLENNDLVVKDFAQFVAEILELGNETSSTFVYAIKAFHASVTIDNIGEVTVSGDSYDYDAALIYTGNSDESESITISNVDEFEVNQTEYSNAIKSCGDLNITNVKQFNIQEPVKAYNVNITDSEGEIYSAKDEKAIQCYEVNGFNVASTDPASYYVVRAAEYYNPNNTDENFYRLRFNGTKLDVTPQEDSCAYEVNVELHQHVKIVKGNRPVDEFKPLVGQNPQLVLPAPVTNGAVSDYAMTWTDSADNHYSISNFKVVEYTEDPQTWEVTTNENPTTFVQDENTFYAVHMTVTADEGYVFFNYADWENGDDYGDLTPSALMESDEYYYPSSEEITTFELVVWLPSVQKVIVPFTGVVQNGTTVTVTLDSSKYYVIEVQKLYYYDDEAEITAEYITPVEEKMIGKALIETEDDAMNEYQGDKARLIRADRLTREGGTIELEGKTLLRVFEVNPDLVYSYNYYPVVAAYAAILTPVYPELDSLDLTMNWNGMPPMEDGGTIGYCSEETVVTENRDIWPFASMAVKVTADNVRSVINSVVITMLDLEGTMTDAELLAAYQNYVTEESWTAYPDWVDSSMGWYDNDDNYIPVINPAYRIDAENDIFGLVIQAQAYQCTFAANIEVTLDGNAVSDVKRYMYEGAYSGLSCVYSLGKLSVFVDNIPERYAVTWQEECEGGEIEVYPYTGYAAENETVYISTWSDTGYTLESIKVYKTGDTSAVVAVQMEGRGGRFTMPAYAVTIEATFAPISYDINIVPSDNGTIIADPARAAAGTTVNLTVTPNSGYVLDAIAYYKTGYTNTAIMLEIDENGKGSFTMPAYAVTVEAIFVAGSAEPSVISSIEMQIDWDKMVSLKDYKFDDGLPADAFSFTSEALTMEAAYWMYLDDGEWWPLQDTGSLTDEPLALYVVAQIADGYRFANEITATCGDLVLENKLVDGNYAAIMFSVGTKGDVDALIPEPEPEPELKSLEIGLIQSATFDAIVNGETLPDLDDLIGMGGMFAEATLVGGITSNARFMSAQWMYAPISGGNIREAEYDHKADTNANNYYIEIATGYFGMEFLVGEELEPGNGIYIHNEDDVAYDVDSYQFMRFEAQESQNGFIAVIAPGSENTEPENPPAENVIIGNNGYPYGKDMNYSSVTLVVDTKVSGATYQWQSSTSEDGTYTDIEGAVNAAYTETYPDSGTWYRCVVNGEVSKAVQIVSPGYDGRNWTASSGSYYVSNGTMAYRVNGYMFDVTGLYYKNGTAYMLQTSYSYQWAMYSSEYAEPEGSNYNYATYADLDALKASFDESNAYRVVFEADLAEGQQAFSFGCDTQLGNSSTSGSYADSAALIGTVKNDSLLQVAMIGAASQEAALGTDPAFVIAPHSSTPASRFWIGRYSARQTYAYNTYKSYGCSVEKINGVDVVTRVEGEDSGMTVSWMNVPSGGSVKFEFKVGSVADTGAVPSASVELTSKTVTIKDTENVFFYQILDENGMPLEGITYMDANGNELTPDEDGWVQGVGGDIIISGLQQSTSYQIVTAAKDENGVLDEENAAVEDVITPINPGVTVDPETGEETEIVCVATGNSLTFTGLNENHYYFLQTEDGYEITGEYIDGELVFSELPAGYDFYLAAVSEDNQTYEPVLYSTNSVTVTFDANGGVDAPEAQTLAGENQYLTWEVPYREGYAFQGWAGSADAERVEYWPDDWPNLSEDTTLYAVWEELEKVDLEGEVVFNYSYSYTLPNGSVQRGTQNEGERATKVRVTLLKNGTPVGEPVVVDVEMFDDYAVGTYCFEDVPLTNEYGSYINYTVQAVALRDDESENRDYGVYCSGYSYVSVSYSPECFDAQWKITINNLDDSYPVPDSVFVKVLYATEQGAELKDYQVITQQVSGYGTECIKVTAGDVITYSGSYPVWKYQADVGGSYYHKVQILGYMLDGVYIDLTDEGYIFDGEMFYDTETNSASEVMELSYNKTLIPTVGVEGDILVNYSYSYTLSGGAVQEGTQNMTERVRTVRVELLCNGIVVDSVDVDLSVVGDIATGSYSFGRWQKYGEHGVNSYSVHAYALDESSETVHDYSVDITRFDAVLTYSPECFDAAWMVVLGGEIPEDLIPSSINVKILYATESGAALEDYEMISQQANNLGVECVLVEDGNGGMTYSGSYPVWKYQADVGGTYYHKIQIVGYTIDGVYYDVSYKALVSEGEMYFDGKNPSCVMEMTLIPEIPAEEITVSGKVLDSNNVGVHGATVELRKGNEVIATTTTDIYGHYSFVDVPDGDYNIVVTYKEGMSDEATEKVLTELVAVDRVSGESPNITMEMPDGNVSSVVEIKEEAVEYQKLDPAGTLVAGVGEVAKNETPADGQHITIKLEVTPTADLTDSDDEAAVEIKAEQAEIKAQASDKILEFLDLTLTKTVSENGSNVSSNIEEASALLTIILPFDTERAVAVVVYRYHDGVAAAMTEKPAAGEEGYVVGDGVVIIYAQKFSTYAIGYREAYPAIRLYSAMVAEVENGTVTIDCGYSCAGATMTVTVTPDDGYELEKLTVIDKNGREVALTDLGNGTYSFRMPNGNVTVSAAFVAVDDTCAKDDTCPVSSFTDTDADEWYHDGVHYCVEEGLMVGMPGDLFAPNGSTTRAQIVTVLWRLEGSPVVDADMTFADVAADEWYTEAIRWAQSVGVVEGYSETAFGPNDTVTREQLAVILYRYEQYKGGGFKGMWMFLLNYPDRADVSDWAYEAMCWMTMHKVIDGVPNGDGVKLDPAGSATRAQVATMLWRFCEETGN